MRRTPAILGHYAIVAIVALALVLGGASALHATPFPQARDAWLQGAPDAAARLAAVASDPTASQADQRDAQHLLARLHARAGRFAEAATAYRAALALGSTKDAPTALDDLMRLGLANALIATGATDEEPVTLLLAVERNPHSPARPEAALARAHYLDQLGRLQDARKAYESVLERWPDATFSRGVRARLGALDVALGQSLRGAQVLLAIVREAPGSAAALAAGDSLAKAGVDLAPAIRPHLTLEDVARLIRERRFEEAEAALTPWVEKEPGPTLKTAAAAERETYLRAVGLQLEIAWENFRFDDALALHDKLKQNGRPGLSKWREIRAHAYDGDFDAALAGLKKQYGGKNKAYFEALGDLYFEFARWSEAYAAYQKFNGAKKDDTDRMVWCLLRMGKGDRAAKHWAKSANVRGHKQLFERYWYARALALGAKDDTKQLDRARAVWAAIVEDDPADYYAHQAWSRLQELDHTEPAAAAVAPPTVPNGSKDQPTAVYASTVRWSPASLQAAFDEAPKPAPLADIEAASTAFAAHWGAEAEEARRAAELVRLGDLAAVIAELRVIDMDLRALRSGGAINSRARSDLLDNRQTPRARGGGSMRDPGRRDARQVAAFRRDAKPIREALRGLQRMVADPYGIRRSVLESQWVLTPELLDSPDGKRLFPIAYRDVVEPLARQFGIPPYFVYAIMTVESAFHPGAVSVASAYGLVQVIPSTGAHLARELGYLDFSPEALLDPALSVYFGGYYLACLLRRFGGQEPLAAAAYNAGPHRVASWLLARGKNITMDMFIEDIPYDQARNYAKRVVETIGAYRRAYHGEQHVYVTNEIRADLGDGPNY